MNILVVHAWLRGNLGDVLQLSVLLSALRELGPRTLDLAGYPSRPVAAARDLLALVDRYVADPFVWYWKFAPAPAGALLIEPWWRRRRRALFSRYDAIVCAPGPYLAEYDARSPSALCDLAVAVDLGMPVVLASHSIGPLRPAALATVAAATSCIARESTTYDYLRARGIACTLAADLAFVYPYQDAVAPTAVEPPYRAVFLRSRNLKARRLRIDGGALYAGQDQVVEGTGDRIVLATSDVRRDRRFLAAAARRLGVPWVGCRTVAELVQLVRGASSVVSDRYHPAICAAVLGKPATVLTNREPHKMNGLRSLLADQSIEELQARARTGLHCLRHALGCAV